MLGLLRKTRSSVHMKNAVHVMAKECRTKLNEPVIANYLLKIIDEGTFNLNFYFNCIGVPGSNLFLLLLTLESNQL